MHIHIHQYTIPLIISARESPVQPCSLGERVSEVFRPDSIRAPRDLFLTFALHVACRVCLHFNLSSQGLASCLGASMPRLTASSIRRAYRFHPSLVPLLQQCRDWTSAQNEFRWIREHVEKLYHGEGRIARSILPPYAETKASAHLQRLCQARGRGQPLQYILGTEFFGDLELAVKPGVLIPRYALTQLRESHTR